MSVRNRLFGRGPTADGNGDGPTTPGRASGSTVRGAAILLAALSVLGLFVVIPAGRTPEWVDPAVGPGEPETARGLCPALYLPAPAPRSAAPVSASDRGRPSRAGEPYGPYAGKIVGIDGRGEIVGGYSAGPGGCPHGTAVGPSRQGPGAGVR